MKMPDKIEQIKAEIEQLEKEYELAQKRSLFDKKQADHIYKKLKSKRKELKGLEQK
jgi:esterase/lipase